MQFFMCFDSSIEHMFLLGGRLRLKGESVHLKTAMKEMFSYHINFISTHQ